MRLKWCFILICIIWISKSESQRDYYHELSMETFVASSGIKPDNLFGYSVTYVPKNKRLIVSAPKKSYIGEVFSCDIERRNCTQLNHNIADVTAGHFSWFGATVKAGEDFFTTCAPRFLTTEKLLGTYSRCYKFSADGEDFVPELLPQVTKKAIFSYKYERLMDSFGWSMAVDGHNVAIGGPAVHKGRVVQYPDITSLSLKPKLIDEEKLDIEYNFGYSIAVGSFFKTSATSFAFSSPYGKFGYGKIIMYDGKKTAPVPIMKDQQVGSLLGASMCSANNMATSSLLVGAPAYGSDHQYNVGAVYIYQFKKDSRNMKHMKTIYGKKDGGYFGYAMTSVGDLNGDSVDEIAISAPYEDDGRGAVYIYSGNHLNTKSEKELTWLQRIQPSGFQGFGASLTMLDDYDENGCNELAIGAPNKETVVLLRCMATIGLHILKLDPYKEAIKSTSKTGPLFKFKSCIQIYYPPKLKNIEADITVTVTITHKNCKLMYGTADGTVMTYKIPTEVLLNKTIIYCQNVTIVTPLEDTYDPLIPYKITTTLNNDPRLLTDFKPTRVMINERGDSSITETLYVRECGTHGGDCKPLLDMTVNKVFPESYTIGSNNSKGLQMLISNKGDVAYDMCMTVHVKGIRIKEWPRSCERKDDNMICKPLILMRNETKWANDYIILDTQSLSSNDKSVEINVRLYTVCDKDLTKEYTKKYLLQSDKNLTVTGSTTGGDVVNITKDNIEYTGKQIQHAYSIHNMGITPWVNFKMVIELEKQYFVGKYTVNPGEAYDCLEKTETSKRHIVLCNVKMIKGNRKIEVILSIDLPRATLKNLENTKENTTVASHLSIFLDDDQISHTISSRLSLMSIEVPLWIIIAASLVGLLLLFILAFILYECGCLRRKNKEKLKKLKREVKRQSMRRSMIASTRETRNPSGAIDVQPLINNSEFEDCIVNYNGPPKVQPESEPSYITQEDIKKLESVASAAPTNSKVQSTTPVSSSTEKPKVAPIAPPKPIKKTENEGGVCDPDMQKKVRADLILGGLQKNLAKQHSMGGSTSSLSKI